MNYSTNAKSNSSHGYLPLFQIIKPESLAVDPNAGLAPNCLTSPSLSYANLKPWDLSGIEQPHWTW